jgi:hypothetical protein
MNARFDFLNVLKLVMVRGAKSWLLVFIEACALERERSFAISQRWCHMERIFQAAAWLLAGTIVVLSLSPPSVQPVTGAAHALEHFLIFLATGLALSTFAAAIEIAQNWVPGRMRE